MSKKVICPYCGQQFDKDKEEFVKVWNGKRYAHTVCVDILEKMQKILGSKCNKTKINKQIKQFIEDDKTPQGILQALNYWYDVKNSDPNLAGGGIGIVPFIYEEAENYYQKKEYYKQISKQEIKDYIDKPKKTVNISRKYVRKPKRVKLFTIN